ncbi:serine hydrolase [Nonomuraea angiospora]|uniref:serine hydrolase n=1 Tax=Nonomuraea angiospora TaxID=46172 RepID=UPI0038D44B05
MLPAPDPDEWMRRLSTLPLMCQPGERWLYNLGDDVLGVLVARVTGQSFETFLRERIFDPSRDERHRFPRTRRQDRPAAAPVRPRPGHRRVHRGGRTRPKGRDQDAELERLLKLGARPATTRTPPPASPPRPQARGAGPRRPP